MSDRTLVWKILFLAAPALIVLGLTIPFGVESGGARAWLRLGGLHLQPSEFARPPLLFFLASYLGQHAPLLRASGRGVPPFWRRGWLLGPILLMWVLSLGILLVSTIFVLGLLSGLGAERGRDLAG